jgi:uncharacterized protein
MRMRAHQALMIFLRYPVPGKVKTRLAAGIGAVTAASIYQQLVRRTLGVAADYQRLRGEVELFVFFHPREQEAEIRTSYPGPWQFVAQTAGHLGEKMAAAFRFCQGRGYRQGVLIGSDIADFTATDLDEAFGAFTKSQAVLGPAADGGFYLLGLDRPCPGVFQFTEWGTGGVFKRSRETLETAGLAVHTLAVRHDIDRAADLAYLLGQSYFGERLSIIVPTLSSVDTLRPWLAALEAQLWPRDEIIVVKGDDPGPPKPVDLSSRCRLITSPRGRGRQLNRGAAAAHGDLLWFLHDDCVPPANFGHHIRQAVLAPRAALGCFRLAFRPTNPALHLIARWANWRTRIWKLPYGDQGIFCRRDTFDQVGGFRRAYLLEDVELVRAARKLGALLLVPATIHTSPRRYLAGGILRTSLNNHVLMMLYYLGVSDRKLYARYYR